MTQRLILACVVFLCVCYIRLAESQGGDPSSCAFFPDNGPQVCQGIPDEQDQNFNVTRALQCLYFVYGNQNRPPCACLQAYTNYYCLFFNPSFGAPCPSMVNLMTESCDATTIAQLNYSTIGLLPVPTVAPPNNGTCAIYNGSSIAAYQSSCRISTTTTTGSTVSTASTGTGGSTIGTVTVGTGSSTSTTTGGDNNNTSSSDGSYELPPPPGGYAAGGILGAGIIAAIMAAVGGLTLCMKRQDTR